MPGNTGAAYDAPLDRRWVMERLFCMVAQVRWLVIRHKRYVERFSGSIAARMQDGPDQFSSGSFLVSFRRLVIGLDVVGLESQFVERVYGVIVEDNRVIRVQWRLGYRRSRRVLGFEKWIAGQQATA